MEAQNVDDVLVKDMNEKLSGQQEAPEPVVQSPDPVPESAAPNPEVEESQPEAAEASPESVPEVTAGESPDSPIDEYGNPVEKPKMYSEEEVQRMIRDRLSRGRHHEPPTQQQVSQEAKDFKADPNSEESWEVQLEAFVEKTIEKRQQKQQEQQWKQAESARQAEFEAKFSAGISKYNDFERVVAGKSITESMMYGVRNLENPAAFVYGAAKMHPQELQRISQIADPFAQAAEIGRLHERMVKQAKVHSTASKPLEAPRSDIPHKSSNQPSLEYRIDQYAKQKRR